MLIDVERYNTKEILSFMTDLVCWFMILDVALLVIAIILLWNARKERALIGVYLKKILKTEKD